MRRIVFLLSCSLILIGGCDDSKSSHFLDKSAATATYQTEVQLINDWMQMLYFHIKHEIVGPPVAARMYGYVGVAMYESVVWGMPEHQTLVGQLNGLDNLPKPDPSLVYDWPTVLIEATYLTSDEMLSRFLTGKDKSLSGLHKKQLASREHIPEDVRKNSSEFGKKLALAIIEWAKQDGYDANRYDFYKTPSRLDHPELWEPTDFNQVALEPFWNQVRGLAIDSSNVCPISLKYEYSVDTNSAFYKQAVEVLKADVERTEEQKNIALYWADCPGETATPPGHWAFIMNYVARSKKMNLAEAVEMYGMVSIGIHDAFVQCWHTKYEINLVRPKTYIRENFPGYEDWEPFVTTPPFPEFASGHSVVSGCAAELMTHIVGENTAFVDSTHVRIGLEPRSFSSFREAANQAAMSRLYGGMHYPMANEVGIEQGKCIAKQVLSNISMRVKKDA